MGREWAAGGDQEETGLGPRERGLWTGKKGKGEKPPEVLDPGVGGRMSTACKERPDVWVSHGPALAPPQ